MDTVIVGEGEMEGASDDDSFSYESSNDDGMLYTALLHINILTKGLFTLGFLVTLRCIGCASDAFIPNAHTMKCGYHSNRFCT